MRKKFNDQLPFMTPNVKHSHAAEYKAVDQILQANPLIFDMVHGSYRECQKA